ncbi:hypothetical protein V8E54_009024 [Elaphomyces granulatus]
MVDEEITSVAKTTGNTMIDDDGRTPILMDLGSIAPSPVAITSRWPLPSRTRRQSTARCPIGHRSCSTSKPAPSSTPRSTSGPSAVPCTPVSSGKAPSKHGAGSSLSMCVLGGDWRFPDEKSGTSEWKAKAGTHPPEGSAPSGNHLEGGAAISEPVVRRWNPAE